MHAVRVRCTGAPREVARVEEIPVPSPGPGRLRIRVGAAAANLPDVMLCRGTYPLRPEGAFTLGIEAAGTVDAVGAGVEEAWLGRRVVGVPELPHGGFAQAAIIPAERAYPVPDDVTVADAAATLIAFQTAHVALHRRGRLVAGEHLCVLGAAGGVGSAAIQLGRVAGARVTAVAGGPEKARRCAELGAHAVVDSSADLASALSAAAGPRGFDVVFDPVGGDAHDAVMDALACDARVLLVGFAGGLPSIDPGRVLRRSCSVVGVYVGAHSHDDTGRAGLREVQADVFAALARGSIHAVVDRTVGLEGVVDALEDLAARRVVGKIVVVP